MLYQLSYLGRISNIRLGRGTCQADGTAGQGNCILTKEDFEKIVLTPASVETFALDTDFGAGLLLEEVVGNLAQGGQVLGSVVLADPALVFTKGYVQTPVSRLQCSEFSMVRCWRTASSVFSAGALRLLM